MSEQTPTRARHQAILDRAGEHLKRGDTGAYWKTMAEISPRYARIAGQVAKDEGFIGKGARERLQDAAEDTRGRRFSDEEMKQIEIDIANRDLRTRQGNLEEHGNAGVSLSQTDQYHSDVFGSRRLPNDTYTLHNLVKSLGPIAGAMRDNDDPNDPEAKARFEEALKKYRPSLGERLRNGLANAKDGLSFVSDAIEGYAHDFQDWSEERQRKVRDIFDGEPRSERDGEPSDSLHSAKGDDALVGGAGEDDLSAERAKLVDDLTKQDDPLEEIMEKNPVDLTEGEVRQVMQARRGAATDAEREKLFDIEKAFFDDKYGTDEVTYDATGRMVAPVALKPIRNQPVPAKGADGKPAVETLKMLAHTLAIPLAGENGADVVKSLQGGLNILNRARTDKRVKTPKSAVEPLFSELKTDGIAGPKTRRAFKASARTLGPAKVKEGMAIGRFQRFAEAPRFNDLRQQTEASFGDLFRKPSASKPKSTPEGFGLQATINDLGRGTLDRTFQPIREDGDIGPRTAHAFKQVLPAVGADRFTAKLGENLGFFDDDETL